MKPFSSDYYDATRQADVWWKSHANDNLFQDVNFHCQCLKSRLRFDYLFSNKISLQRADLLDGACFQHTRPETIREWLDPKSVCRPIQVRTLSGSLEEDLLRWVKRPGETTLHSEPWLLIPEDKDKQYREEFPKLNRDAIGNAKDLAEAIGQVTDDTALGEHLAEYWQSWIGDTHWLDVKKVERSEIGYGSRLIGLTQLVPFVVRPEQVEDAVRIYSEAVGAFLDAPNQRGNLLRRLREELPEILPLVNAYIAAARADADGTKHESLINVNGDRSSWRKSLLRSLTNHPGLDDENSTDITLPDILPQWLSVCEYDELLRKIDNYRTPFLKNNNEDSLKALAEAITNVMAAANFRPHPLPEPKAKVDLIIRCAVVAGGAAWTIANICTSGLEVFSGIKPIVDAIPAGTVFGLELSSKTKEYLRTATQFLAKKEIVTQTIHTFRRRRIVK